MKDPLLGASPGLATSLLRTMLRIRMVEEAIAQHYPAQTMRCPVHLSIGQEAVATGTCAALQTGDLAMSGHRSHAHYLAKGGDLTAMIAELFGRESGCCQGRGGSMHLVDVQAGFMGAVPIVGSTIPIATGLAFADRLKGIPRVTLAFLGEASTEEGVFHESLNFAALHSLPIVYICENNLYSVYSPLLVRQPAQRSLTGLAQAHGLPASQSDGNDAFAVFQRTQEACSRARDGFGPSLLEFSTYRWREHCGPGYDNTLGYRTEEEFLSWKKRDPIARFEERLHSLGLANEGLPSQLRDEIQTEIDAAFSKAQQATAPAANTLFDHVYAPSS